MRYTLLIFIALTIGLIASCNKPTQADPVQTAPASTPTPSPTPSGPPDCQLTAPAAPGVHNLQDLRPGCDYSQWFENNTGHEPDDSYFGDYKILPWQDALYLGFGKARPAEYDGALFARIQSGALTALYQPTEQGFIDMTPDIAQPIIHIPGPDPTDPPSAGGNQWDWGNTYVYTPTMGAMTKHRNLPNIIHTWGLKSTSTGLYAAVSSHLGDYETWTGEVFRSTDLGESWTSIADKDDGVGDYRTYDIIQFNNHFYVVWNDVYEDPCGLAESADGGATWTRLPTFTGYTHCHSRLYIYKNQLLIMGSARDGLLALHTDGSVSTHIFPDFHAQSWAYNPFATDAQDRLYLPSDDGRILRSSDLENWETLVASDRDFISLSYWPESDKIVTADRGVMGRLWLLQPNTAAIQPPPPPQPAISLAGSDIVIQWTQQPGLDYRIYRNSDGPPTFIPPIQYFHAGVNANAWSDAGVATQVGAIFYQVRSKNADGDISAANGSLGKFTFELTPGE